AVLAENIQGKFPFCYTGSLPDEIRGVVAGCLDSDIDMDDTGLAVFPDDIPVPDDIGGTCLHEQTDRQVAIQQEIKNRLPAFAVAGRIFVGNQENIDAVGFTQKNDFIYDLAGITEPPVIARTRSADGTQTGIGNDEIFVLLPIKQIPCCRQIIQTPGNDSFGGLYDIPVSTKGKPGDIVRTATIFQRLEQLLEGHLSFAADDVVNSRR